MKGSINGRASGLWLLIAATAAMFAAACSRTADAEAGGKDMPLVTVGDSTLTLQDVLSRIPGNTTSEDSAAMFAGIVDTWLQDMLLREVAQENAIDIDRIDRMAADYRNRLIINEYIRRMKSSRGDKAMEEQVKAYYDANSAEMTLECPLVKGVYIKLPTDADRIDDVRRWVRSSSAASIDEIEKYGLKGAIQYEYFKDKWVDWQEIAAKIPYRFGDADKFIAAHRFFETSDRNSTYLLRITETIPSGSRMPYDFAAPLIRESLVQSQREQYGHSLLETFAENARKKGLLSTPGYDIKTHKLINQTK